MLTDGLYGAYWYVNGTGFEVTNAPCNAGHVVFYPTGMVMVVDINDSYVWFNRIYNSRWGGWKKTTLTT